MKIAVIFHDSNYYSGATHSMCDICDNWLKFNNVDIVAIFPTEGTASKYLEKKGVKVFCFYYWEMRRHSDESLFYSFTRWLMRENLMIQSYLNAKKYIYPFLFNDDIDVLYSNTASSCVGVWLKKWLKKPLIYHIREFGIEDQGFVHFHGEKWFYRKLRKADHIIIISRSLEQKYRAILPQNDISMIYNDISDKYNNPCFHSWSERITIMCCGAFIAGKGHMDVIKACEIVKYQGYNIELLLVGNNKTKYGEYVKAYIKEEHLEDFINITGVIEDMNSLRSNVNIGVVASTKEAFGRITIEGMLSKMVMIGSDTGATPELINDGETGLIYQNGSFEDLAEKIIWCIDHQKEAEIISENAYQYALTFCKGNCAKKILNIIDKILRD